MGTSTTSENSEGSVVAVRVRCTRDPVMEARESEEVRILRAKCYKIERQLSSMTKEATNLRGIADDALLERDELGEKLKNVLQDNNLQVEDGDIVKVIEEEWEEDGHVSDDSYEPGHGTTKHQYMVYVAGALTMVVCFFTVTALCVMLL